MEHPDPFVQPAPPERVDSPPLVRLSPAESATDARVRIAASPRLRELEAHVCALLNRVPLYPAPGWATQLSDLLAAAVSTPLSAAGPD